MRQNEFAVHENPQAIERAGREGVVLKPIECDSEKHRCQQELIFCYDVSFSFFKEKTHSQRRFFETFGFQSISFFSSPNRVIERLR